MMFRTSKHSSTKTIYRYIKVSKILIKELSYLVAGGCNVQAGDGD